MWIVFQKHGVVLPSISEAAIIHDDGKDIYQKHIKHVIVSEVCLTLGLRVSSPEPSRNSLQTNREDVGCPGDVGCRCLSGWAQKGDCYGLLKNREP